MFRRMFGGDEAAQFRFLHPRCIITIISTVIMIVGFLITQIEEFAFIFPVVMLFVWGFGVIKNLFGVTTIGAIFANNMMITIILFLILVFAAYLVGIFFALIGLGRWIYLMVKFNKMKNNG